MLASRSVQRDIYYVIVFHETIFHSTSSREMFSHLSLTVGLYINPYHRTHYILVYYISTDARNVISAAARCPYKLNEDSCLWVRLLLIHECFMDSIFEFDSVVFFVGLKI